MTRTITQPKRHLGKEQAATNQLMPGLNTCDFVRGRDRDSLFKSGASPVVGYRTQSNQVGACARRDTIYDNAVQIAAGTLVKSYA